MALSFTTDLDDGGYYSAYLPMKFVAEESGTAPDYIYFQVRNGNNTAISGVPYYKAPNIGDSFYYDASSIIKSLLKVRTTEGLSKTSIEILSSSTSFKVMINTTATDSGAVYSGDFYGFAFLDNKRMTTDQTANYGVSKKSILYSNDLKYGPFSTFPTKTISEHNRVNIFVKTTYLYLNVFAEAVPNASSIPMSYYKIDLSAYIGELISIPLNSAFITLNFSLVSGMPNAKWSSFRVWDNLSKSDIYFKKYVKCNQKEFIFINKYGVKETVVFESMDNKSLQTKADYFLSASNNHTGNTTFFNEGSNNQKINQTVEQRFKIEGQKFLKTETELLKDFFTSPLHWVNESDTRGLSTDVNELKPITVADGTINLVEDSKGMEVSFEYVYAQQKNTFL